MIAVSNWDMRKWHGWESMDSKLMSSRSTKAIFQAKTGANVDPRTAVGVTPL
jgi:hypothetical protein